MTTYGAYDAGLPCKNTSCKSHGVPHPNCRCYGDMAEGGDVQRFCSTSRPHQEGCEYFAEGGDTLPDGYEIEEPGAPAEEGIAELPEGYEIETGGGSAELPEGYEIENNGEPPASSTGQKALTALEGGMRGFFGPLASAIIKSAPVIVGEELITPEAQKARREANPEIFDAAKIATEIGTMATGLGQAGAITAASEAATGSKILQSAIQSGLFQTSDEVSKWALGEGDPQDAAGAALSIGAATLFGLGAGAAGQMAGSVSKKAVQGLAETKFGKQAVSFLHGVAAASRGQDEGERSLATWLADKTYDMHQGAFKSGMKFFDNLIPAGSGTLGAVRGYHENGAEGALKGFAEGAVAGLVGKKIALPLASKIMTPALVRVLSSGNVVGAAEAFDHAASLAHGSKMVNSAIDSLFKSAPLVSQQAANLYGYDNLKKDLDTFIGKGGTTQSIQEEIYDHNAADQDVPFAKGGEVKKPQRSEGIAKPLLRHDDGVAIHYPEQNVILSTARGRVSNYLMGLRPTKNQPRLPFDSEPDTRQQKKSYDRALHVAVAPLSVMQDIQKGTIEPEQIKHLNSMYPELTTLLQKRLTSQIVDHQLKDKKPPYKIRQGLSMLLGAPLSSEMTPASIQAAQSAFLKGTPQTPSGQAPQAASGNKSKLSKADQAFLTGPQARQRRSQRES